MMFGQKKTSFWSKKDKLSKRFLLFFIIWELRCQYFCASKKIDPHI